MIPRIWAWLTDPICSRDGRPSNPKLMAWSLYIAFLVGRPLPAAVCAMLLASAFGLKTFQMWLSKSTFANTATDNVSLVHELRRTESVVDVTNRQLTYMETGEPAHSLPAQPDARTPSGGL